MVGKLHCNSSLLKNGWLEDDPFFLRPSVTFFELFFFFSVSFREGYGSCGSPGNP